MAPCFLCKKPIKGEAVPCSVCNTPLHPSCHKVHLSRGCTLATSSSGPSSSSVRSGTPPTEVRPQNRPASPVQEPTTGDIMRALSSFMAEQRSQFDRLNNRFDALESVVADHSARLSTLEERASALEVSSSTASTALATLGEGQVRLSTELASVKAHIETRLEVARRAAELTISGLPETPGEDLLTLVQGVATAIDAPINRSDVASVARMRGNPSIERPRMVHVRLTSVTVRDALLRAKRIKRELPASAVSPSFSSGTVNLNEYLPRVTASLLRRCRSLARERGYSGVWHRDGSVLIRKTHSSPPVRIDSEADIASKLA